MLSTLKTPRTRSAVTSRNNIKGNLREKLGGEEAKFARPKPEPQNEVKIICHEMFHALGAPDLYHYYDNQEISPVGPWDLMESGFGHMGAHMKWKYAGGEWVTSIPEITTSGNYSLNP